MITIELILIMCAIGYIAYIFVAESFNLFRKFEYKRTRKRKQKRQQFLHRCGVVAASVFIFSPLVLLAQPATSGLPAKIRLCLIVAGGLLLVLLLIQAIVHLVRSRTATDVANSDIPDEYEAATSRSPGLLDSDSHGASKQLALNQSKELILENITINADAFSTVDFDTTMAEVDRERELIDTVELTSKRDNIYGSNASKLERKAMDNTIARIRSVFRPEVSISDAIVVAEDLATANDPDYLEAEAQRQVAQAGLPRNRVTAAIEAIPSSLPTPTAAMKSINANIAASLDKITRLVADNSDAGNKVENMQKETTTNVADSQDQSISGSQNDMRTIEAAEKLIEEQRCEIEQANVFRAEVEKQFATIQEEVTLQQQQLEKARETARNAALLARSAASKQSQVQAQVTQERLAREKAEENVQKAVTIAKNAIAALAAEEQKNK